MIDQTKSERWEVIKGFPDYSISDHGRVRRDIANRGARAGHIHSPGTHGNKDNPHYFVILRRAGRSICQSVHRLVAIHFIGDPPFPGAKVLHEDDIGTHNYWENLRWGTSKDNANDRKMNKGWHDLSGSSNPAALLNEEQVIEIRRLLDIGVCGSCIGKIYSISKETVYAIKQKRSWMNV